METLHNTYDAMERLLTISILRYGLDMYNTSLPTHIRNHGMIDNLTMTYDGNRLKKVTDQCEELSYAGAMDFKDGADKDEEYAYDANGNMTCDRNKGIHSITYNMLNLPETVLFNDGHETRYTYAADGRKLRTEYRLNNFAIIEADEEAEPANFSLPSVGGIIDDPIEVEPAYTTLMTRDYCGNYIYSNGTLERILTGNGYIQGGEYYFYIKDYQGNIRIVLNQVNVPVELNSYYPYGALMAAIPSENQQPYKYSAKELDRENGLDLYDSQARHYDPIIPRTTTIDPLAEKYYSLSPYTWCAANPIRFYDSNGMYLKVCDNYNGAADNFAQIAATTYGSKILNTIIDNHWTTVKLKTCFWTYNSCFNNHSQEILYPKTCLLPIDFTFTKSVHIMGHELKHAFDWLVGFSTNSWSQFDGEEDRAVSFQNYLYDEYDTGSSRNQYSGRRDGDFHQLTCNEHIRNFTKIESVEGVKYGYCYNVSNIQRGSKYSRTQQYFLIVRYDANKNIYFNVYTNKVDYETAYKK